MSKSVGFDQKVLLSHLDFTASHTSKNSRAEMYDLLDGFLRDDIKGAKSRKNATTMLMKIWYLVHEDLIPLRDNLLKVFPELTKEERLIAHWGMILAAYPFFKDVVEEMGKLFKLQDEVASSLINRRMKESYGDRRRVEVATSAVLMSIKAWGLLHSEKKGVYSIKDKIIITNPELHAFIIQVTLHGTNSKAIQVDMIHNHSLFFPFTYELNTFELRQNHHLIFHHQGVNELVVERKFI